MTISGPVFNNFEGLTNGTAITNLNSGGASGTAFDAIYGTSFTASTAAGDALVGSVGATIAASAYGGGQWNFSSSGAAANIMFNMKTLSTADAHLIQFSDGTGRIFSVHVNGAGKLRIDDATGTTGLFTFATVLTPGQKYFVRAYAAGGTTTSNGVIKVAYYVGTSQTPAETPYTTTTANLGASRPYTKGLLGKLTASPEAYSVDQFYMDPTATDYAPFPNDQTLILMPAISLAGGIPSQVSATQSVTVTTGIAANSSAMGIPASVSAETALTGSIPPLALGGAIAPSLSIGSGVTVNAIAIGSSGSMPPAGVVPGADLAISDLAWSASSANIVNPAINTGATVFATAASIALADNAPAVVGVQNPTVTAVVATISTAAFVPTGTGTMVPNVRPNAAGVAVNAYAPTLTVDVNIGAVAATVAASVVAPLPQAGGDPTISAVSAIVGLAAVPPSVSTVRNTQVVAVAADIDTSALPPIVNTTSGGVITPSVVNIQLVAYSPVVVSYSSASVAAPTSSIGLRAFSAIPLKHRDLSITLTVEKRRFVTKSH